MLHVFILSASCLFLWGLIAIPTVFFYLPAPSFNATSDRFSNSTYMNKQIFDTILNQLEEHLNLTNQTAKLQSIKSLMSKGPISINKLVSVVNISQNVWRKCNAPLVKSSSSVDCVAPCYFPLLSDTVRTVVDALLVTSMTIAVFCGLLSLATWIHLPILSTFPHLIPMYLIGESLVLALLFALPVMLGWEKAFCTEKAMITQYPETTFCTIQGAFTQYLAISMALWFFCYTFNLYMTLVKNRPDLILRNNQTHAIQAIICWFLPLLFVIVSLAVEHNMKHYNWARSDFYACTPADENVHYYGFVLPVQLACGCGTTLLFLVINYVRYSRESTAGMKLIVQTSKLSGISGVEKRLASLAITYVVIVFYDLTEISYFLWANEHLEYHTTKFLSCKQIQEDCPSDYLHYSSPGMTVVASLAIGAFCVASLLLLFGTAAQTKLWKYWVARLLIVCRCPNAEKWSKWSVMPERHRSFVASQEKLDKNGSVPERLKSFMVSQEKLDKNGVVRNGSGVSCIKEEVTTSDGTTEKNLSEVLWAQETAC